jgi:hypothetical protein
MNYAAGKFLVSDVNIPMILLNCTSVLRYIDDMFLTSNDSIEALTKMLTDANHRHPNIKITSPIDNPISSLDVYVKNIDHNLITSVHRKEAAEPYVVPFRSDHPRHVFVNIIECALQRAVRYSSTLDQFNHERRRIKLMLLYNGFVSRCSIAFIVSNDQRLLLSLYSYRTRYIYSRFNKFFAKYSITSTSITPMIHDENEFLLLRQQLMKQTTVHEHRRAARIARKMDYDDPPTNVHPLVKTKLLKRKERAKFVILHYTHE